MNLHVTSLGDFVSVQDEILSLRAEDVSGSFGILPGHADFLTVLEACVIDWLCVDGRQRHVGVRRAVLRVFGGDRIEIAAREAIVDDDLGRLESTVLNEFRAREEAERSERVRSHQVELQAMRQLIRYLQRGRPADAGEYA